MSNVQRRDACTERSRLTERVEGRGGGCGAIKLECRGESRKGRGGGGDMSWFANLRESEVRLGGGSEGAVRRRRRCDCKSVTAGVGSSAECA